MMTEPVANNRYTEQQYMKQFWAGKLVECMQKMGDLHTNVVLLSLDGVKQVKPYQHYPESPFTFGHGDWRVFYHSHGSPEAQSENNALNEHGHFHCFTRNDSTEGKSKSTQWSHVVAVGMSNLGQPTRLFTTNLWVTDGEWFNPALLQQQYAKLHDDDESNLSCNWLKYLLLIYENEISRLLSERDRIVTQHYPAHQDQCYIDRSIYDLSSLDINLNEKLIEVFQPANQESY